MTRTRDANDPQALALDMEPEPEYFKITREEIDWLCCTSIDTGAYEPGTPEYELACKVRMKTKADIFSRPLAKAPVSDDTTISSLISENARIGAELRQMTERVKVLSGEHDAQITREENKRVLDAIKEYTRHHGYWYKIKEDEKRYHWEPARFDEFLKSLRTQEPPE
jgi:hypothetical protein